MSQPPTPTLPAVAKLRHAPRHWRGGSRMRHGMAIAVLEGAVVGGMFAALETMIVPLVQTRLSATANLVGLLTIVPLLGNALIGPVVGRVIAWLGGNKRATIITCWIQVVALIALSIPLHATAETWALPLALGLAILVHVVGALGGPSWLAWMGGLVPRPLQGRYLGLRNRMFTLCKIAFAIAFVGVMHELPAAQTPWGLQIVLVVAALSRIASTVLLTSQHEPPPRPKPLTHTSQHLAAHNSFVSFLRSMTTTPLGRWTLVWAALHFGVMLAGPYFAAYMLSAGPMGLDLAAGDPRYLLLIYTSMVVRLAAYPFIGRLVDLFGPAAVLRAAVAGIVVIPLFWATTYSISVIVFAEIISGLCWCAAEISVGVLLFSCHRDPAERSRLIGYHQSVVHCVAALGAIAGFILLKSEASGGPLLPPLGDSTFHTLFLLSSLLRLPALILAIRLLPALRELRPEETAGLWRMIPGSELVLTLGRGAIGVFRRPGP